MFDFNLLLNVLLGGVVPSLVVTVKKHDVFYQISHEVFVDMLLLALFGEGHQTLFNIDASVYYFWGGG